MTRIALIHAVEAARAPAVEAFARVWPAAKIVNISDDSLTIDRTQDPRDPRMLKRISALADYAVLIGAEGILYTCSSFGDAIDAAAATIKVPVLKPNEAMFQLAMNAGERIGMLVTFEPAIASMEAEFHSEAARLGKPATITTLYVARAMEALRSGDEKLHNQLVARAAAALRDVDAVMLAHFSTARAEQATRFSTPLPVFSAPEAAVTKLRAELSDMARDETPDHGSHKGT